LHRFWSSKIRKKERKKERKNTPFSEFYKFMTELGEMKTWAVLNEIYTPNIK
jgi:hypothetical protein